MEQSPPFEPSGIGGGFYQDLLEGLPEAVWVGDLDGSVIYWSRGAELLYGYRRDEAVGQLGHELLRSVAAGSADPLESAAEGDESWSGELHRTTRDGRVLTVASRRVLVRSGGRRLVLETSREVSQRELHERLLRDRESLLDEPPEILFRLDAQLRHLSISASARAALGLAPEQLLGKTTRQAGLPAEVCDRFEAACHEALRTGQRAQAEFSLRGRAFRSRLLPERGPDGAVRSVLGVTEDVTERKQLADEVRRNERRLRFITDHAPVMVSYCGPDRRFRFVNRPYAERFGLRPQDLVGKTFAEALGPEAAARIEPYVERVLRGEHVTYETTVPYRELGPRHIWAAYAPELDGAGQVVGFVSALLDITERKRAEEALRASERQLSMIYQSVGDCLFVLAVEDRLESAPLGESEAPGEIGPDGGHERFRFVSINEAFLRTTGFRREQVLGRCIEEVLPESSHALVRERYREALRTGRTVRWEEAAQMPAGRRVGEVSVTPMGEQLEGRRLLVGAVHDITALKQAEDVLREADRRKDEFLAMLAHELRNPLAPIRNAVEVLRLLDLDGSQPHLATARTVIDRQLEHLTHLVDDLLDVSRITRGKIRLRRERADLLAAVTRAVESVRPLVGGRHQQLLVELPAAPIWVDGDVTRLCQVVGNLLHNASKFTDEGGHLSLRVSRRGDDAEIHVGDDGIGIAAEVLPRIFELFTQADSSLERAQGGLGIGLTLVRSLVEMHGGSVEARSAGLGRGSEFIVRLPVLGSQTAEQTAEQTPEQTAEPPGAADLGAVPTPAPAAVSLGPRRRVLIVDDNADAAETLQLLLELDGHQTLLAHDGPTALRLAEQLVPDAVLLDIGLPGIDGYTVAERLRARPALRTALLVALTGYGQEEDRRRSAQSGFDVHLVKPVDVAALRALLRSGTTSRRV